MSFRIVIYCFVVLIVKGGNTGKISTPVHRVSEAIDYCPYLRSIHQRVFDFYKDSINHHKKIGVTLEKYHTHFGRIISLKEHYTH